MAVHESLPPMLPFKVPASQNGLVDNGSLLIGQYRHRTGLRKYRPDGKAVEPRSSPLGGGKFTSRVIRERIL